MSKIDNSGSGPGGMITRGHGCRRCDWQPVSEESHRVEAAEHAGAAGHPLCVVCSRSLTVEELQTCAACIARVRKQLVDTVDLYALLPAELGVLHGASLDGTPRPSDGPALPGGTPLVLLAGGSHGNASVDSSALGLYDPVYAFGAPGRRRRQHRWIEPTHDDHGVLVAEGFWTAIDEDYWLSTAHDANDPSDPPSVAFELARWEDDLRHALNVPAADTPPAVSSAVGYIGQRLTWMAQHHPAFDAFATDLRKLHATLAAATSTGNRPERARVACFDCGRDALQKRYRNAHPCPHEPPLWTPYAAGTVHQWQLAWRDHHVCDQGGLVEDWKCAACGRTYDQGRYYLAYTAWLEDQSSSEPVDAYAAAAYLSWRLSRKITPKQIRHWGERGHITIIRPSAGAQRTLYDFQDIKKRGDQLRSRHARTG